MEIEQQDAALQTLSVAELKNLSPNNPLWKITASETAIPVEPIESTEIDRYIQSLQLDEITKIVQNSFLLQQINEDSLQHKAKITGLDRKKKPHRYGEPSKSSASAVRPSREDFNALVFNILTNRKEKATLQQLMTYSTKLNIPFKTLLPELY